VNKVICDVEEKLRAGEYKLTSRRECILMVLLENKGRHLSAEEVYNLVKAKTSDVGLATVYRTLELFTEFAVVDSMDFGDGRRRYELRDVASHHHHHLICLKCGEIIEADEDLLEELEAKVSRQFGFEVHNHELKILGHCRKCRATGDNSSKDEK